MRNKIVLLTNIKGGVGKTTLCGLLAAYCVERGVPVMAVDADIQQSLWLERQGDTAAEPGALEPYPVQRLVVDADTAAKVSRLRAAPGAVLVDCPGNVDNANLAPLFAAADVAVVPFRFDMKSVLATEMFCRVLRQLNPGARMFLVPNLVTQWDDKREALAKARGRACASLAAYGHVTARVKECVAVRDTSTLGLTRQQRLAVQDAFDAIVAELTR